MWQQWVIALLVPLAACYVVWTLLSGTQRRRLRQLFHLAQPEEVSAVTADDGCGKCAIRNEHGRPQQH
ncbi:MAG TPA: hypothetical protein VF848_05890 [Steroidobacteraceae bacterium]